jgi:hypothetical protein
LIQLVSIRLWLRASTAISRRSDGSDTDGGRGLKMTTIGVDVAQGGADETV